jgi:hypothetical protein
MDRLDGRQRGGPAAGLYARLLPLPQQRADQRRGQPSVYRGVCVRRFVGFLPPLRRPNTLKYLAGPEIGGGNFLSDTSPEDKAAELRPPIDDALSRRQLSVISCQ